MEFSWKIWKLVVYHHFHSFKKMVRWKVPGISVTPPKSNEWIPKMMGRLENVSKRLQTWGHFGYRHVRFQGCSFVLMESHKFLFSLLNCFHHPAACFNPPHRHRRSRSRWWGHVAWGTQGSDINRSCQWHRTFLWWKNTCWHTLICYIRIYVSWYCWHFLGYIIYIMIYGIMMYYMHSLYNMCFVKKPIYHIYLLPRFLLT